MRNSISSLSDDASILRSHLAAIIENSDDAILSKSLEGIISSWNRGAQRIFGYTSDEVIGRHIALLIPSDRLDEERQILDRLKRGERIDHYETIRLHKNGSLIDISLTVSPIKDGSGRIVGASKIARDISDAKRTRAQLREISNVTEHLNEVAKTLSAELDLKKVVQLITDAGTRITRAQFGAFFYNVLDAKGESYMLYTLSGVPREAFASFPMPRATQIFAPTFRGEGVVRIGDVREDPRFGQNFPHHGMPKGHLPVVSYLAVPVIARSGVVLGGLFFGHPEPDRFTERDEAVMQGVAAQAAAAMDNARLYEAEQQAREASEKANAAKDHFLATLSHELRTPLTPVLALISELAADDSLPTKVTEALATMKRNVELEARLIDDLLDLTRVVQSKLELHSELLTVGAVTAAAVDTCITELEAKNLFLIRKLHDPSQQFVGDGARLTQILWNLLKNAIKFTPSGGTITVSTYIHSQEEQREVIFEVTDTGIGIDPSFIERLFLAFEQGGKNVTQQYGGLGLGLAISRALAEAHGGKLTARSEGTNQGSSFMLSIPIRVLPAAPLADSLPTQKIAEPNFRPKTSPRLLYVEDHVDTAKVLSGVLTRNGYQVILANSVASALETAAQEINNGGLDLVISDLGLPDGSGLQLMSELSQRYGLRGIALSGYGMEADVEASRAAGFVHHIIKPVDTTRLRAALSDYFRQN